MTHNMHLNNYKVNNGGPSLNMLKNASMIDPAIMRETRMIEERPNFQNAPTHFRKDETFYDPFRTNSSFM